MFPIKIPTLGFGLSFKKKPYYCPFCRSVTHEELEVAMLCEILRRKTDQVTMEKPRQASLNQRSPDTRSAML